MVENCIYTIIHGNSEIGCQTSEVDTLKEEEKYEAEKKKQEQSREQMEEREKRVRFKNDL